MLRLLLGLLVAVTLTVNARAQNQPANKDSKQEIGKPDPKEMKQPESKLTTKDSKPADSTPSKRPTLDKLKLPADAIIVVIEKLQEAMEMIPGAYVIAPEQYRELLERIRV